MRQAATISITTRQEVIIDDPIYDSSAVVRWLVRHRDRKCDHHHYDLIQDLIRDFQRIFRPSDTPKEGGR